MPFYRYTIDGVETPWPDPIPSSVNSSPVAPPLSFEAPPLTALASPLMAEAPPLSPMMSPSPSPTPTVLGCPPYNCQAFAVPENVAKSYYEPGQELFDAWLQGLTCGAYTYGSFDFNKFNTALASPVPIMVEDAVLMLALDYPPDYCPTMVGITYAGTQKPTTSVPGTVIVETAPPAPVMPVPPMPQILPQVQQAIIGAINQPMEQVQQTIDQVTGTTQGQLEYQLQQVQPVINKITQKIDSNIVNTMGEVYQSAYPVGLGIPTPEQIISGEPVYSPYGIGADIPYAPTPPQTTPPGVTCPAPVVQCPDPPDITFSPNIVVNIPQQDGSRVSVEVKAPAPTPTPTPMTMEPYTPTEPEPTEPYTPTEPTPSPTPSPTEPSPTEPTPAPTPTEPSPTPKPTPTPTKDPPPAPLDIIEGSLSPNQTNWESGASCAAAPNPGGYNPASIWDAFGWSAVKPGEYKPPGYLDPANWPTGTKSVGSTLMNIFGLFTQTSVKAASASIPIVNNWNDFLVLALGGVVQNWVGAPVLEFMKSTVYNINYNNPQSIPSEAECVNLYLAGEIDEQTMRCLVRANGSYDTWYSKIANSGRTKLSNDQIIQLRRRGILDDPTTNLLMRGNGVIDEQEQLWIYKATEAMPSVSDIVRFMVRDADDNEVAKRYGTDDALSTKYGAQLQSWAKGQGITDDVMKYYWRSHWEIPSNTALFEMLHRLRPNKTGEGLAGGITVSEQDIKDALVVNDVLPFWAERLMEISYKPLTRTDAQRAYFIDALSENELKDSYLDLGYNEGNADRLVRFTNQLKAKRKQTTGGTEKVPAVIKYYKNWLIGATEATQRLRNSGLSETAAKEALAIANVQRKNDSQIKCIAGVKSQYKRYIIDDIEARRDLTDLGVALENVGPLVNNWRCERASKPKELSAAQVCSAYQNNLINDVEYRRRLGAIGYQEDEAGILLEICRVKKGNLNDGKNDTTRIRTQEEKNAQTEKARAITAAAMSALNPPLEP